MSIEPGLRHSGGIADAGHTPGPWELCEEGDYSDYDGQCRVICGDVEPDIPIRIAVVLMGGNEAMQAENNANARLIAAAPTMREFIAKRAAEGDAEALQILEATDAHS